MPPLYRRHGRTDSGGTAADDGHPLGCSGRGEQIGKLQQAVLRVHRAGGEIALSHTPETGSHVLGMACLQLVCQMKIGDIGSGHGDEIGLALGQELLHGLWIPKAAHRCHQSLDAPFLEGFGKLQVIGTFLGGVEACHMGVGAVPAPNLEDIHQSFAELTEVQPVCKIIAGFFGGGGGLNFNEEIPAAGLLDPSENLQREPGAFIQGAAAPLICPLVQHRINGVCQNGGPVAHVEGGAVKAQFFQLPALIDKILDHALNAPGGNGGLVLEVRVVVSLKIEVPAGQFADGQLLGLHIHQGCHTEGILLMDCLHQPPEPLLNVRVVHEDIGHDAALSLTVRPGAHGDTDQGCAVFCHGHIVCRGALELAGGAVQSAAAFGVGQSAFQLPASNGNGRKDV